MGCTSSKPKGDAQQKSPNAEPMAPVKEDQVINLQAIEFKVEVTKSSAEEKLGVTFVEPDHEKKVLHVKALEEEGSIPKYNTASTPEKQVLVGDGIVDVNGVSGDAQMMMQELTTVNKLILIVLRDSSKTLDLPVTAPAAPTKPKSEPAPEEEREVNGATGEEGVQGASEANEAAPQKKPEHEATPSLKESSNEGKDVIQQAAEMIDVNTGDKLDQKDMVESLDLNEDGKLEPKDAQETLDLNADGNVDQTDATDIKVEGETGPSATQARNVCCW